MKKVITFSLAILVIFMGFAYSKPTNNEFGTVAKTGIAKVYGNEPFTFIGLSCEDGELYTLRASEKVLLEIRKTKGKLIEIQGYIEKPDDAELNQLKDGFLIVTKWKIIEK